MGSSLLITTPKHLRPSHGKLDQLPKKYKRTRFKEIHPLLRRSVCTLILAFTSIVLGVTLTLVECFQSKGKISVIGFSFLGIGVLLFAVGAVWLYCSKKQLKVIETKMNEIRESQLNKNKSTSIERSKAALKKVHVGNTSLQNFKHAKWPTKKVSLTSSNPDQSYNSDSTFYPEESYQDLFFLEQSIKREEFPDRDSVHKSFPFIHENNLSVPKSSSFKHKQSSCSSEIPIIRVGGCCSIDNEDIQRENQTITNIEVETV